MKVLICSKHLQFLEGDEMVRAAKEIGFDGIDLTVRKGGHVEPARVKEDLPPLVAAIRKAGLETPMVTADVIDADTPHAIDIFAVMKDLGIRFYRWGGFKWAPGALQPQLAAFHTRSAKLAELNAQYGVAAMYHTHSGSGLVGASVWDLHEILRGLDPKLIGVNYDIGHATIEGGLAGWSNSLRITGEQLLGVAVKDFRWEKNQAGKWDAAWTPIGEGMVRFPQFCAILKQARFAGPMQLHFEYPLGGVEDGKRTGLTMSREQITAAMKRDLTTLRAYLTAAQL